MNCRVTRSKLYLRQSAYLYECIPDVCVVVCVCVCVCYCACVCVAWGFINVQFDGLLKKLTCEI